MMKFNKRYTKEDVKQIAKESGFTMKYVEGHKRDLENDRYGKLTWNDVAYMLLNNDFS